MTISTRFALAWISLSLIFALPLRAGEWLVSVVELDRPWQFQYQGAPLTPKKPISWDSRHHTEFLSAADRFASLRECLSEEQAVKDPVDISDFGWQKFSTVPEIEYCVFGIASYLNNPASIADWFTSIGLERAYYRQDFPTLSI